MERYLNIWISKKECEGVPLDKRQIMEMAKEFYLTICNNQKVQPSGFKASTGWLYRFLERKKIRKIVIDNEAQNLRDSVARAVEVAREVPSFESVTENEVLAINSEGDTQSVECIVAGLVIEDELAQAQDQPIMEKNVESEYSGHTLSLILASADNLKQVVIENEKSKMKKAEFVLQIDAALRYYKELHQDMINKRKQTIITRYIRPATSTTTDTTELPDFPLPGPSGEPDPSEVTIDEFTVFMRDVHAFRRSSRAINILIGHAPDDGEDTDSE